MELEDPKVQQGEHAAGRQRFEDDVVKPVVDNRKLDRDYQVSWNEERKGVWPVHICTVAFGDTAFDLEISEEDLCDLGADTGELVAKHRDGFEQQLAEWRPVRPGKPGF